MILKLKNNCIH